MEPVQSETPEVKEMRAKNEELLFKLDEPVTTALNISSLANVNEEDTDEEKSIIVLDKDSVETEDSLLTPYVDIQQNSMSIDHMSAVSSPITTEIQHRLAEMLQENVKLKETLNQNNDSMKQQSNTLVMWQEEISKVYQNPKQMLPEIEILIKHLEKENLDLKIKLWFLQNTENTGIEAINTISESLINASTNQEFEQNMLELTGAMSKITMEKCEKNITSVISQKFADEELQYKQQQSKVGKELESTMKSLSCSDSYSDYEKLDYEDYKKFEEDLTYSEACSSEAKDHKIASLKETIALLEQKLLCVLMPVKLQDLSETSSSLNGQKFVQNVKQYNDMLQELTECFVAQVGRFATIEKDLKEITDILKLDDDFSKMQCKEILSQCCKQLADEQVKIITDRQILSKSQNQFQKIFFDYNSILHEMETITDEKTKLNLQTSELLKQVKNNQQLLEEERRIHNQEMGNLEEEKESWRNERKLWEQEKDSLNKEIFSLKTFQQSKLLKNCEDLHIKRKLLVRYEQLKKEKRIFDQEKNNLKDQKESLESQESSLDMKRESLHNERKLLEQEKIDSDKKKLLLDRQSELIEIWMKNLQNQKEEVHVGYEQLAKEKRIFFQAKDNLEENKKSLESQKNSLHKEHMSLHTQRKLLEQEKISLNKKKLALDQQSKLCKNCEEDLQNIKKELQVSYKQLEKEKKMFDQEKNNLKKEKESLKSQKSSLDIKHQSLRNVNKRLRQNLFNKSKLFKLEKHLVKKKKVLVFYFEQLEKYITKLQNIKENNILKVNAKT